MRRNGQHLQQGAKLARAALLADTYLKQAFEGGWVAAGALTVDGSCAGLRGAKEGMAGLMAGS